MNIGKYKENYNLAHLTWFKVGGNAEIFFKPKDISDLSTFLKKNNFPITIIGAGSNILIRDGGIDGITIKLSNSFSKIELKNNSIMVGASCLNFNLAKFAQENSITGFEFLIGIPGTIGGGIVMNAGAYDSEFKDIVISVDALDYSGNKHRFSLNDIGFAYRKNSLPKNLIFTSAEFKINKDSKDKIKERMDDINANRNSTQPISEKTSGSTFANPKGYKAWELISNTGLVGTTIGKASISKKHCNFLINNGDATASDIEELGELIREKVANQTGIKLQWEIKIFGKNEKI